MNSLDNTRPTWVEINLDNLGHNMQTIKKNVKKDSLITAVVKANAYGHGSVRSAKTFLNNGADRLAVATLSEAIELRKSGINNVPILILGYTPETQFSSLIEWDIIQTIYSLESAKLISQQALNMGKEAKIHIKVDTGMGRIGFLANGKGIEEIVEMSKLPNLNIEGIYTHFSTSDIKDKTYTEIQYFSFLKLIEDLEKENINIDIKHVSNSGAIIDLPDYSLDMVRAGIMMYGLYPSDEVNKEKIFLKPAMTLKTTISHIKTVAKDTSISYCRDFITSKESKIATVPIGYADGIPRLLALKGEVFVKDNRAPIIGRICMDQIMIDVSDINDIIVGDEVVIFGYGEKGYPHIDDIAKEVNTINYEIACMIGRRVPRVYIENGEIIEIEDYLL